MSRWSEGWAQGSGGLQTAEDGNAAGMFDPEKRAAWRTPLLALKRSFGGSCVGISILAPTSNRRGRGEPGHSRPAIQAPRAPAASNASLRFGAGQRSEVSQEIDPNLALV